MKFLIAPNAFKGTSTANEAADHIYAVLAQELPSAKCILQPLADGGDGTCELLISALMLEKVSCWSLNAVGQATPGFFGWEELSKTAYLDVSTCSGIGQLAAYQKDPKITSTYGTGMLIREAVAKGTKHLVLGLGGSASIDLGAGILQALGFLFLDEKGREIPSFSPDLLKKCKHIQRPMALPPVKVTCLCDVSNPFFGAQGALRVFGPQKGVLREEMNDMEDTLLRFFHLLRKKSKKESIDQSGFGAAGGIACGLHLFFDVQLVSGAQYFFDRVRLEEQIKQADWIITGEGRYDIQSKEGKATYELFQLAHHHGKKIALIAAGKEGYEAGFDAVIELPAVDPLLTLDKKKAQEDLQGLFRNAIRAGVFTA